MASSLTPHAVPPPMRPIPDAKGRATSPDAAPPGHATRLPGRSTCWQGGGHGGPAVGQGAPFPNLSTSTNRLGPACLPMPALAAHLPVPAHASRTPRHPTTSRPARPLVREDFPTCCSSCAPPIPHAISPYFPFPPARQCCCPLHSTESTPSHPHGGSSTAPQFVTAEGGLSCA